MHFDDPAGSIFTKIHFLYLLGICDLYVTGYSVSSFTI